MRLVRMTKEKSGQIFEAQFKKTAAAAAAAASMQN